MSIIMDKQKKLKQKKNIFKIRFGPFFIKKKYAKIENFEIFE